MKTICTLSLLFVSCFCYTQRQTFDITTYTPPKAWKEENTESAIQFTKQDEAKGTYCVITLMKSLPGTENSKENFDAAWETVVKEMVKVSAAPEMQPAATEDGWEAQSGYAPFESEGTNGVALLVTSTGFQKMVNILILTNTDVYEKEMTAFLESVSFTKPSGDTKKNIPTNEQAGKKLAASNGFTYSTTGFDDGWASAIKDKWVEVTKGDIKVHLLYPLPYNASDFSGTGLRARDYYWDNYVSKYFTIQIKQYKDDGEVMGSFQPDYVEGWATYNQTGQKRFIGMRLGIAPNAAYITIGSAKDEASFRQQFPKANDKYTSDLAAMSSYNKFAVGKKDLIGKWSSSGGGTMGWYSTTTGNNVGATGAVTADVFQFNSNNTYTSVHNGATGWVGAMNTFQQKYNGAYTATDWAVTATKRWDGKTEKFDAWFEVVKGGRILHLDTPGIKYLLFKEK